MRRLLICFMLVCMVVPVNAQQEDSWTHRTTRTIKQRLDSSLFKKVDTSYIEVPKKAWRVILRPKVNQMDTRMTSTFDDDLLAKMSEYWEADLSRLNFKWTMSLKQPMSTSVGVWVGYRGLGFGYSQSLTKHVGRHFSFSSTGAKYGLNFSLRRFSTDNLQVNMHGDLDEEQMDVKDEMHSFAPIKVVSGFLDGYYVFNGRRYSQAAAYNQSVIQRRSAGSFLLGFSWYQSSIDLSDRLNSDIIMASNDIGKIKVQQGNIGVGYGYNWVPARNWLMNVMVMPSVSVYNRVKVTKYASNYSELIEAKDGIGDYGTWDSNKHQWANGEKEKPFPEDDEADLSWQDDIEVWETGRETKNTRWRVNINARAGITYFGKDWFASIHGQLHRFSYDHNETDISLYDWFVRGALGIRF